MPLSPGSCIDAYEVLGPLGIGGMGEVWLAKELRLGRNVALKLLSSELTREPGRVRRFEQEARAASALNHPNVCTIHALGETADGQHYIAMEFVEGKTLRTRLASTRLSIRELLDIAVQIASALSSAHAVGIVHRDIKPENVMLRPDGLVKVLDFGLAKLSADVEIASLDTTHTNLQSAAGNIVGTVAYMSPEQAEGKPVDVRSDIFSFGSILYEMASGQRAFRGDSSLATLAAILEKDPAPLAHAFPVALRKIVLRCLRKDPSQRYQHISDVGIALEELKEEIGARGFAKTLPKGRRRRLVMTLGGAAVLALVAGAALSRLGSRIDRTTSPPVVEVVPLTSSARFEDKEFDEKALLRKEPSELLIAAVQGQKVGSALDLGTGVGRNAVYLARKGWTVTGVDISDVALELARKNAAARGVSVRWVLEDLDTFDLGKEQWDLIGSFYAHGWHHRSRTDVPNRIYDALKPGGLLVIEGLANPPAQVGFQTEELARAFSQLQILRNDTITDYANWYTADKKPLVRFVGQKSK